MLSRCLPCLLLLPSPGCGRGVLPLKLLPAYLGQEPPALSQRRGVHLGWHLLFSEPPLWLRAPGRWSAGGDGQGVDRNSAPAEVFGQGSSHPPVRADIPWVRPCSCGHCRNRRCFSKSGLRCTASAVTTGMCFEAMVEGRMPMEGEEMPLPLSCTW